MNQLQALAMNEGYRWKEKLFSEQGRAQLEKLALAPWASRRLHELLELLLGYRKGGEMNWAILVVAGLFEVGWAIGLKYTEGFTRLWPTVWTVLAMIISLGLLGIAMKALPVGTAYSVWVGVGAVGTVVLGIVLLGESAGLARMISVALIVAGIVGLKLSTP
jgi:quaternary ammonium compound-resistance protein SugE